MADIVKRAHSMSAIAAYLAVNVAIHGSPGSARKASITLCKRSKSQNAIVAAIKTFRRIKGSSAFLVNKTGLSDAVCPRAV